MIRQNKTSHLPTASAEYKPRILTGYYLLRRGGGREGFDFDVFLYVDGSLAKSTMLQVQLWQICWNRIHLVDNGKGAVDDLPGQWIEGGACEATPTSTLRLESSQIHLIYFLFEKVPTFKTGSSLCWEKKRKKHLEGDCDAQTKLINC